MSRKITSKSVILIVICDERACSACNAVFVCAQQTTGDGCVVKERMYVCICVS